MNWKQVLAAAGIALLSTASHAALFKGELEGKYLAVSGSASTQEVGMATQPEQLGFYTLRLEREGWRDLAPEEKRRIRRFMPIAGPILGVLDPATFLVDHRLLTADREGILISKNDFLIPDAGDPFCSEGVPLEGTEIINVVAGVGKFAHLLEGQLIVAGTIDNCPGSETFGRNDFTVVPGGYLIFAAD